MPSVGSRPQHQEQSVVRRIERGFDFLGYHFGPAELSVAEEDLFAGLESSDKQS